MISIQSVDELEGIIGVPSPRAAGKVRTELADVDRSWEVWLEGFITL